MRISLVTLRLIAGLPLCLVASLPLASRAQGTDSTITSLSGVYTAEQAEKGLALHQAACASCHKTVEFTGAKFWATLVDRPLFDFFKYVKTEMPQDNPGSLADSDYANVISYIFSLNSMPTGSKEMPTDSTALTKIKVVSPAPASPASLFAPTSKTRTGRGK